MSEKLVLEETKREYILLIAFQHLIYGGGMQRLFWLKNGLCFSFGIGLLPYILVELWQVQLGIFLCVLAFAFQMQFHSKMNFFWIHLCFFFLGLISILRIEFPTNIPKEGIFVGTVIHVSGTNVLIESEKGRIYCSLWSEESIDKNTILVTKYHEIEPSVHIPNAPRISKQARRNSAVLSKCTKHQILYRPERLQMPSIFSNYTYGGMMWGLASGQRQNIDDETTKTLRETGIAHVLAISGMHIGLIAVIGAWIGKILVVGLMNIKCNKISVLQWISPICMIGCGFFYGQRVGWPPSAQRAMWMLGIYVVSRCFHRNITIYDILGIAAIAILYSQPYQFHSLGFQLSFTAVFGIALITPRFTRLIPPDMHWSWVWIITSFGVSCGALVGTLPLCALYFQQIPWISPITNLIITPFIATIAVPCSVIASVLPDNLASCFLWCGNMVIEIALQMAKFLHVEVWELTVGITGCLILLCCIGVFYQYEIMLIAIFAVVLLWRSTGTENLIKVTFLSIGQGDAIVIQWQDGKTWLIDGGPSKRDVLQYLSLQGIRELDAVFLSHPHRDHMEGLFLISQKMPIHQVYVSRKPEEKEEYYQELWNIWEKEQIDVVLVNAQTQFDKNISIVHPNGFSVQTKDRVNEESLVFFMEFGSHRFLFTGDIEEDAQQNMLRQIEHEVGSIDVIKIPHHGSRSSIVDSWVQQFQSEFAVISCGYQNQFGHPHQETLDIWKNSTILRTDIQGSIEFRSDGSDMTIRAFHQEKGWYWIKK